MGDRAPSQLYVPTLHAPCRPQPPADLPSVVAACRAVLTSSGPIEVAEEYGYASLPLRVIDSVFSIGVRYESVGNVIERYCRRFGLPERAPKGTVQTRDQQKSTTGFLVRVIPMEADRLATEVFGQTRAAVQPRWTIGPMRLWTCIHWRCHIRSGIRC